MQLAPDSPWAGGCLNGRPPQLLFGRMYEDPEIELLAFAPGSRVFCIAAAGCTARALAAAGHEVTAVDINPAQAVYAMHRAQGGPPRAGAVDRLLARIRSLGSAVGWTSRKLRTFLELDDPARQLEYWDRHLDTARWRGALDLLLSPALLALAYHSPFVRALPCGFSAILRARLRRCWATHPNRSNPFAMSPAVPARGRFQGMLQIAQYNRAFYLATLAGIALVGFIALYVPQLWRVLLLAGAAPAFFWLSASLAVSHYVYDRSSLYDLSWLFQSLPEMPHRWLNIHAGLDETSHILAAMFPGAHGEILDIYDAREMTEPSIARARRITHSPMRAAASDWRNLPFAQESFDAIFVIFAAHELRRPEARDQFFRELARVAAPEGRIVLVEHLRDWPNFLAFGPGFLHFFSWRTWLQTAEAAGFSLQKEFSKTPFIRVFLWSRRFRLPDAL